jgi:hypothetical protein
VTHDEHGGFFDHAIPPGSVHPGDSITDNENNHNNFDFSQLGVRVPAVVISPFIRRNVIDHRLYDHSSVIKTVGEIFRFGRLTDRDGSANSLTHLLSLSAPRTDAPSQLPSVADSGLRCTSDATNAAVGSARAGLVGREQWDEINREAEQLRKEYKARRPEPIIRSFLQVALRRYLSVAPISKRDEIVERFLRLDNSYDARLFIREATEMVKAHKLLHPQRKPWKRRGGQSPEQK